MKTSSNLRRAIPALLEERRISDDLTAFELYSCWGVNFYKRKIIVKNRRERVKTHQEIALNRKGSCKKDLRKYSNGIWWHQLPF